MVAVFNEPGSGRQVDMTTPLDPNAIPLPKAEDALHVSGDYGIFMLAVRNDSGGTIFSSTNGDYTPIAVDQNGRIQIIGSFTMGDASGNPTAVAPMQAFNAIYNGVTWDRQRGPNIWKPIAPTAVVAGTGITVWTPTASKKFRLMGWALSLSVAGEIIFGDNLAATVIARTGLLAASSSNQGPSSMQNGILSAAANNVLKVDVTAAGNVQGFVFGTEE